jgi:hypothetical protein
MVAVFGCKAPFTHNLPPAQQIMHPGPGVDGPGPGVMLMGYEQDPYQGQALTSQVAFVGPEGMIVLWDVSAPGMFDSEALVVPGRYNFPQAALYRLKLTEIPGREGIELYPTLEIGPSTPRIDAYLAHNTIPVQFTEEDFDQVLSGNFVTKVIYLPDAEFQELALAGVETLVSTRLDPGLDPIVEADRRGSIMAIVRIGNKDLEVPGDEATMGDGGVYGASYDPNCDLGGVPPDFLAGVTAPEWGMPMSGTPIGLPGPPHIPLGAPAGLRKHVIRNHTHVHIPRPTRKVAIDVKQSPGMSYPRPAHRAWIHERIHAPWTIFGIPLGGRHQHVAPPVAEDCPPGEEVY